MTNKQIIAYVSIWNSCPPGYPQDHALYYFDEHRGWTYLTPEGHAYRNEMADDPEYMAIVEKHQSNLNTWAREAASLAMKTLSDTNNKTGEG